MNKIMNEGVPNTAEALVEAARRGGGMNKIMKEGVLGKGAQQG